MRWWLLTLVGCGLEIRLAGRLAVSTRVDLGSAPDGVRALVGADRATLARAIARVRLVPCAGAPTLRFMGSRERATIDAGAVVAAASSGPPPTSSGRSST